jgi:hypothetical protein
MKIARTRANHDMQWQVQTRAHRPEQPSSRRGAAAGQVRAELKPARSLTFRQERTGDSLYRGFNQDTHAPTSEGSAARRRHQDRFQ